MNYDSVILTAIALFAVGWWFISGRKHYIGPRVKAQIDGPTPEMDGAYAAPRGAEVGGMPVSEPAGKHHGAEADGVPVAELEERGRGIANGGPH